MGWYNGLEPNYSTEHMILNGVFNVKGSGGINLETWLTKGTHANGGTINIIL